MLLTVFVSCIALGAVVGYLAGLLGIGGGLVIVPALVHLLPLLGIDQAIIMPMALATSLSTIVITSTTAAFAHHKNGNIPWPLTKELIGFIAVGALLGAFIADNLSAKSLALIFSCAVIALALYMLRSIRKSKVKPIPSVAILRTIGLITGSLASLMGISGGAILIPTLTYFGLQLRHTIGVATACGMVVAFFGSIGYVITGWHEQHIPDWSLGYIYLPALLGIVSSSSLFARMGVRQAKKLPVTTLKKMFAVFLIIVALKMIFSEVL